MGGFLSAGAAAFTPDPGPIAVPGNVGYVLTVGANGKPAFAAAAGGGPSVASVVTDKSFTGSATPQNDSELKFTGLAAGYYALIVNCSYWLTGGSLLNYTVNLTGTPTHRFCQSMAGVDGSNLATSQSFQTGTTAQAPSTGSLGVLYVTGMIAFSSAANSVIFAWAPTTAAQTATIRGGSWATLTKVG